MQTFTVTKSAENAVALVIQADSFSVESFGEYSRITFHKDVPQSRTEGLFGSRTVTWNRYDTIAVMRLTGDFVVK